MLSVRQSILFYFILEKKQQPTNHPSDGISGGIYWMSIG